MVAMKRIPVMAYLCSQPTTAKNHTSAQSEALYIYIRMRFKMNQFHVHVVVYSHHQCTYDTESKK